MLRALYGIEPFAQAHALTHFCGTSWDLGGEIIGILEGKAFGVSVEFNHIWRMILGRVLGELSMYLILSQCDTACWSKSPVCADLTRSLPSQAYPPSLI